MRGSVTVPDSWLISTVVSMSDLEDALSLNGSDRCWTAFADPRYESLNAMFGGWTTAVALRAALLSSGGEVRPSAITVNFVDRVEPGTEISVTTRQIGGSRSVEHWLTEVCPADDDRVLVIATVVLTNRRDTDGHTQPTMPHAPDPDSLGVFHPPGPQGERSTSGAHSRLWSRSGVLLATSEQICWYR